MTKRFNVNRLGEQYQDVTLGWLESIVTVPEYEQIKMLRQGQMLRLKRSFAHPHNLQGEIVLERAR